jgi:hypothetical protein
VGSQGAFECGSAEWRGARSFEELMNGRRGEYVRKDLSKSGACVLHDDGQIYITIRRGLGHELISAEVRGRSLRT